MEYSEYINGIDFKIYKPKVRHFGYQPISNFLKKFNFSFEIVNTKLPLDEKETKQKLGVLKDVPRMSTFAVGAMINQAVSEMNKDECFVNVGVWNGFTFLNGILGNDDKKCIGVDNFSEFGGPRDAFLKRFDQYKGQKHQFFDMDYEEYFSLKHEGKIGFYIYDGEHSYKNQLKGLQVAEPFFADDCVVLVDDTNWKEPKQATLDFIKESKNKYEIILDKATFKNGHPTLWNGVMIFRKINKN